MGQFQMTTLFSTPPQERIDQSGPWVCAIPSLLLSNRERVGCLLMTLVKAPGKRSTTGSPVQITAGQPLKESPITQHSVRRYFHMDTALVQQPDARLPVGLFMILLTANSLRASSGNTSSQIFAVGGFVCLIQGLVPPRDLRRELINR